LVSKEPTGTGDMLFTWIFEGVKIGRTTLSFKYHYAMPEMVQPEDLTFQVMVYGIK
jgi:hypothetical protein